MKRPALFIALSLLMATASAQSGPDAAGNPGVLSLKGVTLGMQLEEAKQILGNHDCKDEAPGLVTCTNVRATINGMEAVEILLGMDGKVVALQYRNMKFPQSETIRDALVDKFGEPTRTVEGTAYTSLTRAHEVVAVYWGSERGEELWYSPWAASEVRAKSLAKVRLVDHTRYDLQWEQRIKGVYVKPEAKSDI